MLAQWVTDYLNSSFPNIVKHYEDWDAFAQFSNIPARFPLLTVYRQGGSGKQVDIARINIDFHMNPSQVGMPPTPGSLRYVEVGIAEALQQFEIQHPACPLNLRLNELETEYLYVAFNTLYSPTIRATLTISGDRTAIDRSAADSSYYLVPIYTMT